MSSTIFRTRHHHSPRCASKTRYGSNLTGSTPPSVLELCPVTDTNKSMFSMLRSSVGQYVCGGNRLAVFGHVKPRFSHIEGLVLRLYGGNIACPVLPRARCRPYSTRNAFGRSSGYGVPTRTELTSISVSVSSSTLFRSIELGRIQNDLSPSQ